MGDDPRETPSADWQDLNGDDPSDHSLMRYVRCGSQDAATKLYFRYAERLRALAKARCSPSLARRVDPEDIVQSVFHRFFQHARRGDYDVPAGEELWKLFLVIALNKIRKEEAFHRAAKRDVGSTFSCYDSDDSLPMRQKPDEANEAFLQMAVSEALERLPEAHQKVVQLRIDGYEVAEIALLVRRSQRTVERILQEARKKLKILFHGEVREGST